ncbi:MAG: hypothetical protein FJ146_18020 [Deltaproteobacteria bacterium]|nr:hypothetical protein [Deltaproteobacteria bacterium]
MTDGLKRILAKVAETPTSTMIDRYLALVSELPSELDKTERVLDLGESLIAKAPTEALRVVGMVHDAAPKNLRAYDILIAAFEKLGRAAKAGVLRFERDKLHKSAPEVLAAEVHPEIISESNPVALVSDPGQFASLPEDGGSIADLATSLAGLSSGDDDYDYTMALGAPPSEQGAKGDGDDSEHPGSKASSLSKLQSMVDGFRRDRTPSRVGSALKSANATRNPLAATKSDDTPSPKTTTSTRVSKSLRKLGSSKTTDSSNSSGQERPDISTERTSVAVLPPNVDVLQLVDFNLADPASPTPGSLDPERIHLLAREAQAAFGTSMSTASPGPLNDRGSLDIGTEESPTGLDSSKFSSTNLAEVTDLSSFWDPLHARMAKVDWDQVLTEMLQQRESLLETLEKAAPLKFPLPPEAISAIITQFQAQVISEPTVALTQLWDIIQGIWGDKPDAVIVTLLQDLNLTRATRGFWGFYLDALLARGSARRVLFEVATVVARERQLSWAKTGWQRLPTAWRQLGLRGFQWQEDEGVDALLTRLRQRPRQMMSSLILGA